MREVTTNEELIIGNWYWVKFNDALPYEPQRVYGYGNRVDTTGDAVKYLGANRMWCHKDNSQVFPEGHPPKYKSIIGPIIPPN